MGPQIPLNSNAASHCWTYQTDQSSLVSRLSQDHPRQSHRPTFGIQASTAVENLRSTKNRDASQRERADARPWSSRVGVGQQHAYHASTETGQPALRLPVSPRPIRGKTTRQTTVETDSGAGSATQRARDGPVEAT